jgi:hypothetical protein
LVVDLRLLLVLHRVLGDLLLLLGHVLHVLHVLRWVLWLLLLEMLLLLLGMGLELLLVHHRLAVHWCHGHWCRGVYGADDPRRRGLDALEVVGCLDLLLLDGGLHPLWRLDLLLLLGWVAMGVVELGLGSLLLWVRHMCWCHRRKHTRGLRCRGGNACPRVVLRWSVALLWRLWHTIVPAGAKLLLLMLWWHLLLGMDVRLLGDLVLLGHPR